VLSFLTTAELCSARASCRSWRACARSPLLWRSACTRDWLLDSMSDAADAEAEWRRLWRSFGRYTRTGVYKRVVRLWRRFEHWATAQFPELVQTLVRHCKFVG
jgi:hypothetical protein